MQQIGKWSVSTISNILQDRIYTGDLVQHKYSSINYKIKKVVKLEQEKYIVIENNHEPIISKEEFEKVEQMLKQKSNECKRRTKANHILTGIAFCRKCGARITYTKNHGVDFKIICSNYKKNGKTACDNIYIDEQKVINIIKQKIIENIIKQKIEKIKIGGNIVNKERIERLKNEKDRNIKAIKQIYYDISSNDINKLMGRQIIIEYSKENEKIDKNIEVLKSKIKEKEIDIISKINGLGAEELRSLMFMLINKIEIDKNQIIIHYNFKKYF